MSTDDSNGYVDQVRANTSRYIRELLDENERLRTALERMEREHASARRYEERFSEVEQQNANLAALYAASYQLHATPQRAAVLDAIQEIVINLIGSEELAVIGVGLGGELSALAQMGCDPVRLASIRLDVGVVARAIADGAPVVRGVDQPLDAQGVTACVPLIVAERVVGLILVFSLLPQKPRLERFDLELFGLLGTHAATALYCSELHERDGRPS
jgi:nitrate/nitrite-specific signal transduction histidine kinase